MLRKMREKEKKPSQKNKALRMTDSLTVETLKALCRENTFPKRTRWLLAQPIADIINAFHTEVMVANEIKVETYGLMVERYERQTVALAYLEAANIKMSLALTVLDVNADNLERWAEKFNELSEVTISDLRLLLNDNTKSPLIEPIAIMHFSEWSA